MKKNKQLKKKWMKIKNDPHKACSYAFHKGVRIPELEKTILKSSKESYRYAAHVIKGRWPEAEELLSNSAYAVKYAEYVVKGRWDVFEKNALHYVDNKLLCNYMMEKSDSIEFLMVEYARDILGGRWPEIEKFLITKTHLADKYAIEVIKDRWPEFESNWILHTEGLGIKSIWDYVNYFGINERIAQDIGSMDLFAVKSMMSCRSLEGDFFAKPLRGKKLERVELT